MSHVCSNYPFSKYADSAHPTTPTLNTRPSLSLLAVGSGHKTSFKSEEVVIEKSPWANIFVDVVMETLKSHVYQVCLHALYGLQVEEVKEYVVIDKSCFLSLVVMETPKCQG